MAQSRPRLCRHLAYDTFVRKVSTRPCPALRLVCACVLDTAASVNCALMPRILAPPPPLKGSIGESVCVTPDWHISAPWSDMNARAEKDHIVLYFKNMVAGGDTGWFQVATNLHEHWRSVSKREILSFRKRVAEVSEEKVVVSAEVVEAEAQKRKRQRVLPPGVPNATGPMLCLPAPQMRALPDAPAPAAPAAPSPSDDEQEDDDEGEEPSGTA